MDQNVDVVIDGQYGSTGKGLICQTIADNYKLAVTCNAPNAGHTIRWDGSQNPEGQWMGRKTFKARHVPSSVLNKDCKLAIGAGALIGMEVLEKELQELHSLGVEIEDRLYIDPHATMVQTRHVNAEHEKKEGSDMFDRIGSTREGCGPAWAERVLRRGGTQLAYMEPYLQRFISKEPVSHMIRSYDRVLLEGAQGTGLSNIHGIYPYTTFRDTTASGFASAAGVPPRAIRNVIMVIRTYPIRVAGMSGPTGGKELDWTYFSKRAGKEVSERTTVTNRVRRIFEFSMDDFKHAVILNGPNIIALNFLNYLDPSDEGKTDFDKLGSVSRKFIDDIEAVAQAPVLIMSTSADSVVVRPELQPMLA